MTSRVIPTIVNITPETRIWFASSTQLVSSNAAALQLISVDSKTLEITTNATIDLAAEDIAATTSFDDNLFILSRAPSESQWARKWRRRVDLDDDEWTCENPLYAYTLRLYSLASASQVGPPLPVPYLAVDMKIRAREDKVIVMTVGPYCVASIMKAPVGSEDRWLTLHEELTWDPHDIASQRGYENPDEEPTFLNEEDEPSSERYEYHDREILDYAFLSDTFVLRLSESALDRGEASFFLDVFQLTSSTVTSQRDRDGLKFGRDLPRVLEFEVDESWAYIGMTTAFLSRDNTSIDQSDVISLTIYSSDTPRQFFIRASKLLSFIYNPSSTDRTKEAIIFSETGPAPFTRWAKSLGKLELTPVLSKHLALFPTCDIAPTSQHPTLTSLRFLDFRDSHWPPIQIDIPLASLLTGATGVPSDLDRAEYVNDLWPRFGVQWDGGKMLVVSFMDVVPQSQPKAKAWLVKMDVGMLQRLGLP